MTGTALSATDEFGAFEDCMCGAVIFDEASAGGVEGEVGASIALKTWSSPCR